MRGREPIPDFPHAAPLGDFLRVASDFPVPVGYESAFTFSLLDRGDTSSKMSIDVSADTLVSPCVACGGMDGFGYALLHVAGGVEVVVGTSPVCAVNASDRGTCVAATPDTAENADMSCPDCEGQ